MKLILWFWLILILITFGIFCHAMYLRLRHRENRFYIFIASTSMNVLLWMLFRFIIQYSTNVHTVLLFHELKYICILSLPILFYYHSYAIRENKLISANIVALTSFLATLLFAFVMTNNYHHFFRIELNVINTERMVFIETQNAFLFYVVVLFCYVFISLAIRNFIIAFRKQPLIYRNREFQLIVTILIPLSFNILFQVGHILFAIEFDPTPIGFFLTLLFYYVHFILSKNNRSIQIARSYIMDNMDLGILYLNQYGQIQDANTSFYEIADVSWTDIFDKSLQALEKDIFRNLNSFNTQYHALSKNNFEIVLTKDNQEIIYQIIIKDIKNTDDKNGEATIGTILTFNDITILKTAMDDLAYLNTHDNLTLLENRFSYELKLKAYDDYHHYPLGIIICHTKILKEINDRKGYLAGDALLVNIARHLETLAPEEAEIFRTGSSEFSILVPNTNTSDLRSLSASFLQLYNHSNPKTPLTINCDIRLDQDITMAKFLGSISSKNC